MIFVCPQPVRPHQPERFKQRLYIMYTILGKNRLFSPYSQAPLQEYTKVLYAPVSATPCTARNYEFTQAVSFTM